MRQRRPKREAKVLALFVLLLPGLAGMVSLVVDAGIMLAMHRQAQSGADAGALAAARDLLANSSATMPATAQAMVGSCSNLSSAGVQVNCPPLQGNFAGNSQYVEVIVTVPVSTYFIQVLTNQSTYLVTARAVAGIESVAPHEIITCLSPSAVPGLGLSGIGLTVNGTIAVNSQGSGVDQNGNSINYGSSASAVTLANSSALASTTLRVVGGVSNPSSISSLSSNSPAFSAGLLPRSDPFLWMPTPTTATGVVAMYPNASGVNQGAPCQVSLTLDSGQSFTLSPGIYTSIEISGAGPGTVTFQPGVYVFQGGNSSGHALWIDTGGTIVAAGVLIYSTANSYNAATGTPDVNDGNALGTESGATFGAIQIKAATLTFQGLSSAGNPFNGMMLYQRRWSTQTAAVYSGTSSSTIGGTIYARWGVVAMTMSGSWGGQIVAGSVSATGLTASATASMSQGTIYATSPRVFLVE